MSSDMNEFQKWLENAQEQYGNGWKDGAKWGVQKLWERIKCALGDEKENKKHVDEIINSSRKRRSLTA